VADKPKVKVAFTQNAVDPETLVNYWRGQVEELEPAAAGRMLGADLAVRVDQEDLKKKNVDELKQDANALGVDVSGKKSKEEIAKEIAGKK
jgi:hypothetical protein